MAERQGSQSKSEEELIARQAEIATQLRAEQATSEKLHGQIEPLERSLRPLQNAHYEVLQRIERLKHEDRSISTSLQAIEQSRQEVIHAQSLLDRVFQVREALQQSQDPIIAKVAQVMGMITKNERFVAALPGLVEPDLASYAARNNSGRISVATRTDGVRMIICEDGDIAVIHHRPDPAVVDAIQEALAVPDGYRVSPHLFGVRVRQQLGFEATPFVREERIQDRGIFNFQYLVGFPMTAPALKPIESILSEGDISLRTDSGKLIIPRQPI